MSSPEMDLEFFTKFDNSKAIFSFVFSRAKKLVVIEDEEGFVEDISDQLVEGHGLTKDEAEMYARNIYAIWQDKALCSVTAFNQEMKTFKKQLFGD